ncbi:MAG: MFS transporter [Erysipelotrichaceae bacterium]|nr:MFS transporter [Erysipelotrichaceae bacterium]
MKKNGLMYLFTMLGMCGTVGAAVGVCMGTAGLFYSHIANDLSISSGSVSMMYTITALSSAFSGLLIPLILKKENMLKPLIIGASILSCGGTFLLSTASNIWLLYIYSVIRGVGAGMLSFVLATSVINNWFYARNGLMVSIAMAFSGLPGVLLSNIITNVILASGWRFGYVFVTIVMLVFCAPAILLPIRLRPQSIGMEPYGYEDYLKYREANKDKVVFQASNGQFNPFSIEMISLLLFTIFVCIIAGMLQHLPSFALSLGFTASIGALMSSMASTANIVSKLMYGVLTDKIGSHKTSVFCALINFAAVIMMMLIHTPVTMIAGAFMFGFSFANSATAMSVLTRETFGMENYTRVYPIIAFTGSTSNALGVTLLGMLYDATGSYYTNLILTLILQGSVILITLNLLRRKKAAQA